MSCVIALLELCFIILYHCLDETKKKKLHPIKIPVLYIEQGLKSVTIYVIPRMGRNFGDYSDFQQKAQK